jgi:hypothetical protein
LWIIQALNQSTRFSRAFSSEMDSLATALPPA